ncbi:MAG: outer membrane beta-barrel protein [Crocinitomicaceae bacterium]
MKKVLLFMGAVALSATSIAQTPVAQGNVIIDPYIGVPNWANSILYNQVDGDGTNVTDYAVNGGMLSYGGRVEYMLSDDFGMGIDVNYEVSGFNYNDLRSVYDEATMTFSDVKYNYDYKSKKLRAMLRLNYHFVQNDRVDAYTAFAGGYKNVNRTFTSTDPNADDSEATGALVPVAFRLAVGARVYFTDNIGAHVELGAFGGALLQFGVSVKLPTY